MKLRTVKQLEKIANRIGLPFRKNIRKNQLQQEILSWINSNKKWAAIEGRTNESR